MARTLLVVFLLSALVPSVIGSEPREAFAETYVTEARRWQRDVLPDTRITVRGTWHPFAFMDEPAKSPWTYNSVVIAGSSEVLVLAIEAEGQVSVDDPREAELYRADGHYSFRKLPGKEWLLHKRPDPDTQIDPFQTEWMFLFPFDDARYYIQRKDGKLSWKEREGTLFSQADRVIDGRWHTLVEVYSPPNIAAPRDGNPPPRDSGERKSSRLFSRTDGLLLARSEVYSPSMKATYVREYSYEQYRGRLVPKKLVSTRRLDNGVVYPVGDLDFEYASYTPVKSDFSLEQFGLPDLPEYQKPKPRQYTGLWILVGGIVLIVVALTLRSRLRKRLKNSSPPPADPVKQD